MLSSFFFPSVNESHGKNQKQRRESPFLNGPKARSAPSQDVHLKNGSLNIFLGLSEKQLGIVVFPRMFLKRG